MASKRNKLLIFLGLITIAVSKAHNYRYGLEHEFESKRTSASKPSANPRQIVAKRVDLKLSPAPSDKLLPAKPMESYRGYLSAFNFDEYDKQRSNILARRSSEGDNPHRPSHKKRLKTKRQHQTRIESAHHDSSDRSVEINPVEFHFEPKKVNPKKVRTAAWSQSDKHYGSFINRRTGLFDIDTEIQNTDAAMKKPTQEAKAKDNLTKDAKEVKVSKDIKDTDKDTIKKKKRKKVLRVRVRARNSSKDNKDDKVSPRFDDKEKLIHDTTSNINKNKATKETKIPKEKTLLIVKDEVKTEFKNTSSPLIGVPLQNGNFHSGKKDGIKKIKVAQNNETKNHEEDSKVLTFYRRSGQKVMSKHEGQKVYPKADWVSMFQTENRNKEGTYYVLSFNYMGNKNRHHAKDIIELPYETSSGKKQRKAHEKEQKETHVKDDDKYLSEFDTGHFENVADKFLEKNRQIPKYENANQDGKNYPSDERDIKQMNDDNSGFDYYPKETDGSKDHTTDQNDFQKQLSPTVALKRKKNKKQKDAVWKLQETKKNYPDDQWKHSEKTTTYENQDNFKDNDQNPIQQPPNTDANNYYVRSFIKLPSGDNVDLNLKGGELTREKLFSHEDYKEFNSPRKPLISMENKGSGNYFMRMYKKVGNIEDFDVQSGEKPENKGYQSSLKLSWNDDDTRAQVEEAVDSRAFVPIRDHSYSTESTASHESGEKDVFRTESSENIMQYKSAYVDDFIAPLTGDKSHFYDSVSFMHRHKRSLEKSPRLTSHFTIGNSQVKSNYTLDHKPRPRFFSMRLGPNINPKQVTQDQPITQTQTQSRNADQHGVLKRQRESALKSYYHKPVEAIERRQLRTEFKGNKADVFDKYEKPSRNVKPAHVFHSYQAPNRDPKQAQDMTYFRNDKNSKMEIKIFNKGDIRQMRTAQPILNRANANNTAGLNNFRTPSGATVIQSSTDIRASYVKPETENKTSYQSDITTTQSNAFQKDVIDIEPTVQSKVEKTTKSAKDASTQSPIFLKKELSKTDQIPEKQPSTQSRRIDDKEWMYSPDTDDISKELQPENKTNPQSDVATTQSNTLRKRVINKKPTVQSRIEKTTKSTTDAPTQTRFFHKIGLRKTDQVPDKQPSAQSRRIDDKHWIHDKHDNEHWYDSDADDVSKELQQDVEHHLEKNVRGKKHMQLSAEDSSEIDESKNRDLEPISKGVTPQVPFEWDHYHDVRPTSEKNYPMYHSIPKTHFTCKTKAPGYYADPETDCQVFHMCQGTGEKHSFLCPNTTLFNQKLLVCDWHSKVDCGKAESLYDINNRIFTYQAPLVNDRKPQVKKQWNSQQDRKDTKNKYAYPKNEQYSQQEYQPRQVSIPQNTEVTDVPQFIVDHFKVTIPNAEIGKPRSVTKSYRTVIARPNSEISSAVKNKDFHYLNERNNPVHYKLSKIADKLVPEKYIDKQKAVRNSWNTKDMQRAMKHELLNVPEISKSYHDGKHIHYIYPLQEKSHQRILDEGKRINPSINSENIYHTPILDTNKYLKDDDVHFAGRQNEKVIVVNRNRLQPDYESHENQESPESETTLKEEALNKFTFPRTSIITQSPSSNMKNSIHNERKLPDRQITQEQPRLPTTTVYGRNIDGIKVNNPAIRHQYHNQNAGKSKQQHEGDARTQYHIYPLIQNSDGSKEFNYGFKEDPKTIDLQNTRVLKLDEPLLNKNPVTKQVSNEGKDPQAKKIKWRIEEIKSGVESIGAQIGNILGGNDKTFKNVRVYKLKPENSKEEFQEIRLLPFKFERHSRIPQNLKVKEEKGENVQFYIKSVPKEHESVLTNSKSSIQVRPIKQKEKSESYSNSKVNTVQNRHPQYENENTYIALPKLVRQVMRDIAPKYNESPTHTLRKPDYKKSSGPLQSYDQIKIEPQSARNSMILNTKSDHSPINDDIMKDILPQYNKSPTHPLNKPNYIKSTGQFRSYDQIKVDPQNGRSSMISNAKSDLKPINYDNNKEINPNEKLSRAGPGLFDSNAEFKTHPKTNSFNKNNKNYEIKYIPLIKLEKTTNPSVHEVDEKSPHKHQLHKIMPESDNQKSEEYFEHIFVPKRIQEKDTSFFLFPDKINVQDYGTDVKAHPVTLNNFKFPDVNNRQNMKYNPDNIYKQEPINYSNLSEKLAEIKASNLKLYNNHEPSFKVANPHSQKKDARTFLLFTKPVPNQGKYPNTQTNYPKEYYEYDATKTTTKPTMVTTMNSNKDPNLSLECDDSTSDPNSYNSFTLGKNGPSHDNIKNGQLKRPVGDEKKDLRTFYNTQHESIPKCRGGNRQSRKSQEERQKNLDQKQFNAFLKPVSKITFKDIKRPENAYTSNKPTKFNPKAFDKTEKALQPKVKPVKLFQFQRNSRPAFMKPLTSPKPIIGVNPVIHESRDFQPLPEKIEEDISEESKDDSDKKSAERSKRVANIRHSRYADLEKEVELKTKSTKKENENTFQSRYPAARNKPQGKIIKGSSEESSDDSSIHSKHSKYAGLERAAELEAERMIHSTSQST